MRRFVALSMVIFGLLLSGLPARAAFQLVLKNGVVLTGVDLEREPGRYVLIKKDGQRLTIEMDQVAQLRIVGDDIVREETPPSDRAVKDESGEPPPAGVTVAGQDLSDRVTRSEPTTVGGAEPPVKSSPGAGKSDAGAETIAGAVPGSPLAPGEWRPESDWPAKDPDWPKDGWITWGPDTTWTPQSDYATDPKANEFNPSTWSKPAMDPTWQPTDGFRKMDTSLKITTGTTGALVKGKLVIKGQSGLKVLPAAITPAAGDSADASLPAMAEGSASWYGESFRGRTTASGHAFDPDQLTAAHGSLPFGTMVLVTRRDQPALSVVVEINDRGTGGRLLNLSRGAAKALDMLKVGVVPVVMIPMPAAEVSSQTVKPVPERRPEKVKNPKTKRKDIAPEVAPGDDS